MNSVAKGRIGERAAAAYLERCGFEIVDRNFRTRRAEIDLVAVRGDVVVFVEVKTWETLQPDDLERAIGPRKRAKIARCARAFLAMRPEFDGLCVRFDVLLMKGGEGPITHLEGAFTETSETW